MIYIKTYSYIITDMFFKYIIKYNYNMIKIIINM